MPAKFLTPPLPIWGLANAGVAEQLLLQGFNNSGGTLKHGDVVIVDTSVGQMPAVVAGAQNAITGAMTTTAVAKNNFVLGPVSISGDAGTNSALVAAGATIFACVGGVARVNVTGAAVVAGGGANPAGSQLQTAAVVKQALQNGVVAAGDIGSIFAIALEAQAAADANTTVRCLIAHA